MTLRHKGINQQGGPGLVVQGPLVRVVLGPHPEDAKNIEAAGGTTRRTEGQLLVDTGAQLTVVENTVAVALGLVPIRYTRITGVSGRSDDCPIYRMSIAIGMAEDGTAAVHQGLFVADVAGVPSPPVKLTHVGLLGRDFLTNVRLLYDGPQGEFHLIDYKHVSGRATAPKRQRPPNWRQIQRARKKVRRKAQKGRR